MGGAKHDFRKLTPTDDVDISAYEERIDFALSTSNPDVRNIAVSGPYGSGKSSILASYKRKHPKKKFITVSLAHFRSLASGDSADRESSKKDGVYEESIKEKESVLEERIVNQLIHQIPPRSIPNTRFRIKKDYSKKYLFLITAVLSLWLLPLFFMTFLWEKFSSLASPEFAGIVFWLCLVLSMISISFIIFWLVRAQLNTNLFRRIKLQGNEIEVSEKSDDSYFDKYLDEILYLLDKSEADAIVFEDIDRFSSACMLFERLHEISTLINVKRTQRKCVRLCDLVALLISDLVGKTERKSASSQEEKQRSLIERAKEKRIAPLRFVYLIRDDIFVSKDRIKFFDLIIPVIPVLDSSNSYDKLRERLEESCLLDKFDPAFLEGLSLYIDDMRTLTNICNEFGVYYKRLNKIGLDANKMLALMAYKNLFPRDFSGLQLNRGFVHTLFAKKGALIASKLQELQDKKQEIKDEIENIEAEHLRTEEELDAVYKAKDSRLPKSYYNMYTTAEGQQQAERYAAEKEKRLLNIQRKHDGSISRLKKDLAHIEREIGLARSQPLKNLITSDKAETVFRPTHTSETGAKRTFEEVRSNDYFSLLKYLIRNGFIDESHPDYMTYFYENSMTFNDKKFLRRVTDQLGAHYDYTLDNPERILASATIKDAFFREQDEVLNFDLFEHLFKIYPTGVSHEYVSKVMDQMGKEKEGSYESKIYDFILKFYLRGKQTPKLIEILTTLQEKFFFNFRRLPDNPLSEGDLRKLSYDILEHAAETALEGVNFNNCLTEYISESCDYGALDSPDIGKLIDRFKILDVKFIGIDYELWDKELFDGIYSNSLYQLNADNITLMLEKQYGCEKPDDIAHKNFTLIQERPKSPLALYVKENISEYLGVVVRNCGGRVEDAEDVAISLLNLNNEVVEPEIKKQYIRFLKTKLFDITAVEDKSLWNYLLGYNTVRSTANNIYSYFSLVKEMDGALVQFINSTDEEIDLRTTTFDGTIVGGLLHAAVTCNKLENDKYRQIIKPSVHYYQDFKIPGIAEDKFLILVESRTVRMNSASLEFIRENYAKQKMAFIEKNLDDYLEILTPELFDKEEALSILNRDIEDEKKLSLLKCAKGPIPTAGLNLSDEVRAYIIENDLYDDDIQALARSAPRWGEKAQRTFFTTVKIGKFSLEKTSENHMILKTFKTKGWISDYKEDEENPDVYIVIQQVPE